MLNFIFCGSLQKLIYRFQFYPFLYRNLCSSSGVEKAAWESIVGLEIHAQINAQSKLFSNSATLFNAPTNSQVTYFDASLPGCLPVLNRYCIEAGVLTALALNCEINKISTFDRKHYFYPDLPAGYQITQQFHPLAKNGYIKFRVFESTLRKNSYECCSNLKQIQLEQDSGRSFHVKGKTSFVDLNRAGIGLMELVFDPNLKNGNEAYALVHELVLILRCLGVCSCDMEEGAIRVDANISVNRVGEPFGIKTEVKNINSFRHIAKAIDYEIDRQIKVIENGGSVNNETRAFDYSSKKTVYMRDKETLQDYRFMPEPNLPPIRLFEDGDSNVSDLNDAINIDRLKEKLPPLPEMERATLVTQYGLTYESADRLVNVEGIKPYFEEVASHIKDNETGVYFLMTHVQHFLNLQKISYTNCPVTPALISEVVELYENNTISERTAWDILEMLFNGDTRSASEIVKEYNWYQIMDGEELEKLCREAMVARPKMVQKYRKSKKKRYMTSLLAGLNEIANNRACIKDAERVFIRLIFSKLISFEQRKEDVNKDESANSGSIPEKKS